MRGILRLIFFLILISGTGRVWAQCSNLLNNYQVDFVAPDLCAPTNVNTFSIQYNFINAQNPAGIQILFRWNDPANTETVVDQTGMTITNGNKSFKASASFTYPANEACTFKPEVVILVNGVECPSSRQEQIASAWAKDNEFGATLSIGPKYYDVCYSDAVNGAIFKDNSFFNCNITIEKDNPNEQERNIQFVYGNAATHNPANTIANLTLEDGGTKPLTNGTGNLAATYTRGTGSLLITAAYFGPVETVPFPAKGPTSVSLPISAPGDPANVVGSVFEVTMFNWNICNPYNGNALNPNYQDAISTTAYIRIVDDPKPDFEPHANSHSGPVQYEFCVGQDIFLKNLSSGATDYIWEFYDGPTDTDPSAGSLTAKNPKIQFGTPGQKLVRLIAKNATSQSACERIHDEVITISDIPVADIETTDLADTPLNPVFCQIQGDSADFTVRFHDVSTGPVPTNTTWKWEFYDNAGNKFRTEADTKAIGPFDQTYTAPGKYEVDLTIRNNTTGCSTNKRIYVTVLPAPVVDFTANGTCEGNPVEFTDISTLNNPLIGETIASREWDFDYDGVIFNPDGNYTDSVSFKRPYPPGGGTYTVALQVTTSEGCDYLVTHDIEISPLPFADISASSLIGCSAHTVSFTNNSVAGQPVEIAKFIWQIDDGSGWKVDSVQDPADTAFSNVYDHVFVNNGNADMDYRMRLGVESIAGCKVWSAPVTITVHPAAKSGFVALNYSPFNNNCSPLDVDFQATAETQALSPLSYDWNVLLGSDTLHTENTGTIPDFSYTFNNTSQGVRDYIVNMKANFPGSCPSDSSIMIRVNPVPNSDFIIDTLLLDCDRFELSFNARQPGLDIYSWTIYENGVQVYTNMDSSSLVRSFDRTMNNKNISVRLKTSNFAGCQSGVTNKAFIVPRTDVVTAMFTADPAEQDLPTSSVSLTNTSSGSNLSYHWDFGNGETSDLRDPPPVEYGTHGDFIITLEVMGERGCLDSASQLVKINPIPPIVDFSYAPDKGCAPLTVEFTNLSRFAYEDSYVWDFGDGKGKSRAINPTYTYSEPGTYSVSLSATNILGDTVTMAKSDIIEVYPVPYADFKVKSPIVYLPDDQSYFRNDSRDATEFWWDLGDGTTSTEYQPIHTYTEVGIYDVMLVATNKYGCRDTTLEQGLVEAKIGGRLLVPNAFSPNVFGPTGGGLGEDPNSNDIFRPKAEGVIDYELMIFNRWGEMLFYSTDKNIGWDGYYKGKLCAQDVYVYQIKVRFVNGERVLRTGDINLIR